MELSSKTILVTGGTGSFGQAFARYALETLQARKVIIYSRDEYKQFLMRRAFKEHNNNIRFFIGDVRDQDRLYRALFGVDAVVHAAAMKHVPIAEYNPFEAVQTNVIGAQNVINACIDAGVKRVIALSTDKACNPVNLYGATKLCSDKLFIAANAYSGGKDTRFAVVRYGNVLGSRGSVVPYFTELAARGEEIPITDPSMTRFWITLPQAIRFVATTFAKMQGGELCIPKIPSMRIVDLAEAIAPGRPYRVIGIRPGEKLHEQMISADDSRNMFELPDRYIKLPDFPFWEIKPIKNAVKVPIDFSYRSDTNLDWLDAAALRRLIREESV